MEQENTNSVNDKHNQNSSKLELSEHHFTKIHKVKNFFYGKPILKVPLFLGGSVLLYIIFFVVLPEGSNALKFVKFFISMFVMVYLLFFVIQTIGKSLRSLITANNIIVLLLSYAVFMFCILLFFASMYDITTNMGKGYLTYGTCSDKFDKSMIQTDSQKSDDHFYFSAVTLFTVGYGDICPMGWDKTIAIINAFVGVGINAILMVLVISNYMDRKKSK